MKILNLRIRKSFEKNLKIKEFLLGYRKKKIHKGKTLGFKFLNEYNTKKS